MTENRLPLISFNLALITILHYFLYNKFYFFMFYFFNVPIIEFVAMEILKISHFVKNL